VQAKDEYVQTMAEAGLRTARSFLTVMISRQESRAEERISNRDYPCWYYTGG